MDRLLKTEREMDDFLKEKNFEYNPQKIAKTIFFPTEKYTTQVWGFNYTLKDLEKIIDFN